MPEPGKTESPTARANHELENAIQAERSAEFSRREGSDYPHKVRLAERFDVFHLVVDVPVQFWNRYGGMNDYEQWIRRAAEIRNGLLSENAQKALCSDWEPWMQSPVLKLEEKMLLAQSIKPKTPEEIDEREQELGELRKPLVDELERCAKEYSLITGKVVPLFLGIRSLASGQNIGQVYMETPPNYLLSSADYVDLGKLPAVFMEKEELGTRKAGEEWKSYPTDEEKVAYLKERGYEANVPLGIGIDRAERAMYLQSLSYTPDRIVKWMARAKKAKLRELERNVDEGFINKTLISQKNAAGEDLFPAGHEIYSDKDKYKKAYWAANKCNETIENAWWVQHGFRDAEEGKKYFGDPLSWIPFVARRGVESTDYALTSLKPERLVKIKETLQNIRLIREGLTSPTITEDQKDQLRRELAVDTSKLRGLMTEKGKTLFNSLALENRLGLRGDFSKLGVIEAIPQRFGPKSEVLNTTLHELSKGDKLAAELGKMLHSLWGLGARYGFYARDLDLDKLNTGDVMKAFNVDVEGWPYSDELSKLMALTWWQIYKRQAAGPEASRGKYGPVMLDLLSHSIVKQKNQNGEELFRIIDINGGEKVGLAENGMVIGNLDKSLLEMWEEGVPFGDLPWTSVEDSEDMSRRWMLRAFFGEGRGEISVIDILTESKWDPKKLTDPGFVEAFKLAVKVDMKPYLFDEIVWRDVVKPLDEEYIKGIVWLRDQLSKATTPEAREKIFKEYGNEEKDRHLTFSEWQRQRKEKIDEYIYAWWWEGVMSTPDFQSWAHQLTEYGERSPINIGSEVIFAAQEQRPLWLEIWNVFRLAGINLRRPFATKKLSVGLGGVKEDIIIPADPKPNSIKIDPNP